MNIIALKSNRRDVPVSQSPKYRGSNDEPSTGGNRHRKGKENKPDKGRRAAPFDNKYGVDLRLCK